jgi:hypothetical protein
MAGQARQRPPGKFRADRAGIVEVRLRITQAARVADLLKLGGWSV